MNTDQVTSYQSMKQLADTLREKSENLYSLATDVDAIVVLLNRNVSVDKVKLSKVWEKSESLISTTETHLNEISKSIEDLNLNI